MKLPQLIYSDNIRKAQQTEFGGYNHTLAAGDGDIFDMENLSSRFFPLLSPRSRRVFCGSLSKPNGIFARDALLYVDGRSVYYDGALVGEVEDSEKVFSSLGVYIIIFPDKAYYNILTGEFRGLEAHFESAAGAITFENGTLFDEAAECNTLTCPDVDWNEYFKVGDAVTIDGCTLHPENNKTPVIREISADGRSLRFYEYVFKLGGAEGNEPYTEPGVITVSRTVPDLDWLCCNENRLWGCAGDSIYCCKLGDPFNWNVFDGLSTDSYAVTVGSAGDFTGCVSFLGYPVFFKPGNIYKVYGTVPSNFQVMGSATLGVIPGGGRSLAVAGETLFYLSRGGIAAYSGGMPKLISAPFGEAAYKNAVAGSDGVKYFVSMEDEAGGFHLFVYDTRFGVWHREDDTKVLGFAFTDRLYALSEDGLIFTHGECREDEEYEDGVSWSAEFGDFTESDPNKKGVSKLQIRLELDEGADFAVEMRFDSAGEWQKVADINPGAKRSFYLPIIPRRADHYRIRLSGAGGCRVFGMVREFYSGSELRRH